MREKYYAVKIYKKQEIIKLKQVDHINAERELMTNLDHPFIAKLFASFKNDSCLYLVMEAMGSGELFTHLRRDGHFQETVAKFYAAQVVELYRYLHSQSICHRELKPENMVHASNGYVKFVDFGFTKRLGSIGDLKNRSTAGNSTNGSSAAAVSSDSTARSSGLQLRLRDDSEDSLTLVEKMTERTINCIEGCLSGVDSLGAVGVGLGKLAKRICGIDNGNYSVNNAGKTGYKISKLKPEEQLLSEVRTYTLCGTPEYIAPEILLNKGHNTAADWWSLGILIYEMVAGFPPFCGEMPMEIYQNALADSPKFLGDKFSNPNLKNLINVLLDKSPDTRFGNRSAGADDVINHKWFANIDFEKLRSMELECPYKIPSPSEMQLKNRTEEWEKEFAHYDLYQESAQAPTPVLGKDDPFDEW